MKLVIKEKQIDESDLLVGKKLEDAVVDLNFKIQPVVAQLHTEKVPLQVAVEYIGSESASNKLHSVAKNGYVTLADIFMLTDVLSNYKEY